jgi:hypothetical protein
VNDESVRGAGMVIMATFRFMQATAKTAMRRVLGIRGGQGETLVPPTAVAGGDQGFVFSHGLISVQTFRLTPLTSALRAARADDAVLRMYPDLLLRFIKIHGDFGKAISNANNFAGLAPHPYVEVSIGARPGSVSFELSTYGCGASPLAVASTEMQEVSTAFVCLVFGGAHHESFRQAGAVHAASEARERCRTRVS